jgi:glycosyltransferase involved in cell wall biosynthesis
MQREYNNIVLIDQENQGVSRARNNGIDKASGKYLIFVDPDDYIDNHTFDRILEYAEGHDANVTFLGFTFLDAVGNVRKELLNENHIGYSYSGSEAYFLARGDGLTDPDRMVAVLFETVFMNRHNLRYLPDVPYLEDGEFIARILCLAERCVFDGHSFYQRTSRPGSATNSKLFYSDKATNGFILAVNNLKRFQEEQNLDERQREFLNQPIAKFAILAINSSISRGSLSKYAKTVKRLRLLSLSQLNLKGCSRIYSMYGKAYNVSPYLAGLFLIIFPRLNFKYLTNIHIKNPF